MKNLGILISLLAVFTISLIPMQGHTQSRTSTQKSSSSSSTRADLEKDLRAFAKKYEKKQKTTTKTNKQASANVMPINSDKIKKPSQSPNNKVKNEKLQIKDDLNTCTDGCLDQISGKGYKNSAAICLVMCGCILDGGGLDCALKASQKMKKK